MHSGTTTRNPPLQHDEFFRDVMTLKVRQENRREGEGILSRLRGRRGGEARGVALKTENSPVCKARRRRMKMIPGISGIFRNFSGSKNTSRNIPLISIFMRSRLARTHESKKVRAILPYNDLLERVFHGNFGSGFRFEVLHFLFEKRLQNFRV